ncbi:hypothetical protein [Saliniramus fredricksonii]|uniref:Flippase-like domain-containing protein n=1 Tax=Saliniramus fredricksonii TaxID=1653334 RepID=A0ABY0K6C0_9HYPH|nr:hypothetical protein [Saliniramus fredricksonii]SCC79452.1 hypothetical protein GA0071312_0888 [Saliniramus fredricksonii]
MASVFKRDRLRPVYKWLARLALVGSFAFVYFAIHQVIQSEKISPFGASTWFRITLSSFGYALLLQLVALAWTLVLRGASNGVPSVRSCLLICGRTQIYKYLPTNMLHLVGRYQAARSKGASHRSLGLAQVIDLTVILLAAAAVAAALGYSIFAENLKRHVGAISPLGFFAITASVACIGITIGVIFIRRAGGRLTSAVAAVPGAFVLYVIFFIGNGALMAALINGLVLEAPALAWIVAVTTIAWVVGYVVPGAPGGLGVRDASLIASLGSSLPIEVAVAAALAHRLVTTFGDAIVAALAFWMSNRTPNAIG